MISKKVVVLVGGYSTEKEISFLSGEAVSEALLAKGHKVFQVELDQRIVDNLRKIKPDIVFIALHGRPGEDGTIQGLLELLGIPYTGSGVLASALCLNKLFSKKIFLQEKIPIPSFIAVEEGDWKQNSFFLSSKITKELGLPVVIKPVAQGSSVGVSIAQNQDEIDKSFKVAFQYDDIALAEEYIEGREVQCGILGNKDPYPLPLVEIIPKKKFFDYEAKYTPGLAEEITPAPLSDEKTREIKKLALRAYRALGCRGFARVDMFLRGEKILVSEVNSIPGLTKNSLFPKEARAAGIEFPDLVEKIIELGMEGKNFK